MNPMNFNLLFSRLIKKSWPPKTILKYVGSVRNSYFCYSSDQSLRKNAASGGCITALLIHLLNIGKIDGALVCRSIINSDGKCRPEFFIAKTPAEIISAQGSKYSAVYFSNQAIPLIKEFNQKLAVVALPCDTKILRTAMRNDIKLNEKVALIITLFCGHNSEPILTDQIIESIRPRDKKLINFRYRTGHWRGFLQATFEEETVIKKPFSYFSDYQNLFFFSQRKCHHCFDHTGYYSDISVGDIWSLSMRENPIKHSALITRSEIGDRFVTEAINANVLTAQTKIVEDICEGQARNMPTHYNISARSKVGRFVQENIRDTVHEKVRIPDYLVAGFCLLNSRISRTQLGKKIIFIIPRPILKGYLLFIKILESI